MKTFPSFFALAVAGVCLAAAAAFSAPQAQTAAPAKACGPDETVVGSVMKDVTTTIATVKKESLDDFERLFHQQVVGSRLSTTLLMTNMLLDCLDKAAKDPSTPKGDIASIQTRQKTYTQLKTAIQQDIDKVKSTKDPKAAKADIEAFSFTL